MKKLQSANEMIKAHVKENYPQGSWEYVDFVSENRFLAEIQNDKDIDIVASSAEIIAQHAIDQIRKQGVFRFIESR